MFQEAVHCELGFADDILKSGVSGLSFRDMKSYLGYVADLRLRRLGEAPIFHSKNPFDFMTLQDTEELTNFFERRVSAYQKGIQGEVSFDESF